MINTKKQAFTLVELIVVITILAILGAIAFMSLKGYSADARNSKRLQDLNNISSAINNSTIGGTPLFAFVTADVESQIVDISIAGTGITATGGTNADYTAGSLNHTALGLKASDFQDPNEGDYRIGVTTDKGGKYELASIYEDGSTLIAKVTGTYTARSIAEATATGSTGSGTKIIVLDSGDIGKFYVWDTVVSSVGSGSGIVNDISNDGLSITLNFTATSDTLKLADDEELGLIEETGTGTQVVTDGDTVLPY